MLFYLRLEPSAFSDEILASNILKYTRVLSMVLSQLCSWRVKPSPFIITLSTKKNSCIGRHVPSITDEMSKTFIHILPRTAATGLYLSHKNNKNNSKKQDPKIAGPPVSLRPQQAADMKWIWGTGQQQGPHLPPALITVKIIPDGGAR